LASFRRAGRTSLAEGTDYDTPFNRAMNTALRSAHRDHAVRQVKLYDFINARVLDHRDSPNVLIVRHERWLADPGAQRQEIAAFLGVPLHTGLIRLRDTRQPIAPSIRELVNKHCSTAQALGYTLD
jgi:hypothetical protein